MSDENTIQEIRERLVKIEVLLEKVTDSNELKIENIEEKIKVSNHRIEDLENTITWLWRAVVGSIITGAIALLFKFN